MKEPMVEPSKEQPGSRWDDIIWIPLTPFDVEKMEKTLQALCLEEHGDHNELRWLTEMAEIMGKGLNKWPAK